MSAGMLVWGVVFSVFLSVFVLSSTVYADDGITPEQAPQLIAAEAARAACLKTGAIPTACPPEVVARVEELTFGQMLGPLMKAALVSVIINVAQFVLDKIAYNTAVWLASGGKGQTKLVTALTGNDAWNEFGLEILADTVTEISDATTDYFKLGFDVCAPSASFNSALAIGIQAVYAPPKPRCDWTSIQNNWSGFIDSAKNAATTSPSEYVLDAVAKGLRPGQNALSAAATVSLGTHEKVLQTKQNEFFDFLSNNGFKGVVDSVTGKVETPASIVEDQTKADLEATKTKTLDYSFSAAITNPDLLTSLLTSTISVFTNTLLSTVITNIHNGLLASDTTTFDPFASESADVSGREEAEARYASLIATTPSTIDNYNVLTDFITCPSGTTSVRQMNNCVMDSSFFDAVARGNTTEPITIAQAIDDGLLHGTWPLYRSDDLAHNQDPLCYTYGYCFGNLVKLRKARIIPIGFEIAADSSSNTQSAPVTLQEVVDGFDSCSNDGSIDASHPWCHLIDPNWVLKYPTTQCRASTIGDQEVATLTPGRSGVCVDTPSCIDQNDDGTCNGYGYCVREKNVWNFRGDECPEQYAGCLSFTNADTSDQGSWLLQTLDFNTCSAANAGCLWYRTNKYLDDQGTPDDTTDDTYEWLPTGDTYIEADRADDVLKYSSTGVVTARASYGYDTDGDGADNGSYDVYAYEDRIYYNNQVQACDASEAGCSQLYPIQNDLSLNLIQNASFEDDTDGDGVADNWDVAGTATYDTAGADAFHGTDGYALNGGTLTQKNVPLQQNRFYTISFYAQGLAAGATVAARLTLSSTSGETVNVTGYSSDCTTAAGDTIEMSEAGVSTDDFTSYDCAFTTPTLSDDRTGLIADVTIRNTSNVAVDAVQLEVGENATDFHTGYNSTSPTTSYLKVPPAWLHCEGKVTDPAECADYALVCSAAEVGCADYTPTDGDPTVPAVLSDLDQCPSECSGYATFKQEATDYDSEEFPLYFIASTAQACTEDQVGCDEFTNLTSEAIETYTTLRACVTPDMDAGATYFTWEGSDATGYQLVSYQLLQSDAGGSTVTFTSSGNTETNAGAAPCSSWSVTSESTLVCVDDLASIEAQDTCDEHDDILTNPDCREFYDANGGIHYRLYSETVSVDSACTPYRITTSTSADCAVAGGYWNSGSGECRYFGLASASTSCPAEAAGCRSYTGGTSENATTIVDETFESGTYADYEGIGSGGLTISNESVATNGHSLRVTTSVVNDGVQTLQDYYAADHTTTCPTSGGCASLTGACTVAEGDISCGTLVGGLTEGKTYLLKFWAKGSGDIHVGLVGNGGAGPGYHDFVDPSNAATSLATLSDLTLTGGWQQYTLGPLDTSAYTSFNDNFVVTFTATAGQTFYLDNLQLIEAEENVTLVKDSWVTPSTCDETPDGASAPQYYLGCETYTDKNNSDVYIYQFTNICSEAAVGCTSYYDTHNASSEYTKVYNGTCYNPTDTDGNGTHAYDALNEDEDIVGAATDCELEGETVCTIAAGANQCQFDFAGALPATLDVNVVLGPETVIVPGDEVKYYIDDGSQSCDVDNMGCTEVGTPTFSADRTVVDSMTSTYLLNQPDTYDSILCDNRALFCAEWGSTQDGNFYFKDPVDQNCEYKTGVTADGSTFSGWFRSGTNEFCYGTGTCSDDSSIDCSLDSDCAASGAGTCTIDTGTYIQGGDFSAIWNNGDTAFSGWAGACSDAYDLCTDFIDPQDTGAGENLDGQDYFFKDNESLDESTLSSADRCNGQISLKDGCVLFNNTIDEELTSAASPTYLVSEHADQFLGGTPGQLVDPVSCDDPASGETSGIGTNGPNPDTGDGYYTLTDGTNVNVCEQRCEYDLNAGQTISGIWAEGPTTGTSGTENIYWGSSCIEDADCASATDSVGNTVTGTCRDLMADDIVVFGNVSDIGRNDSMVFANDTNRELKVYRDRECAQWLTNDSEQLSWDSRTNMWTGVTSTVALCDNFSGTSESGFCTDFPDEDPVVLDADRYSSRDTSWYGLDYSGYAIPEQLPIEFYSQDNVNPIKGCFDSGDAMLDGTTGEQIACTQDSDCGSTTDFTCESIEADYRLAYAAGTCDKDNGVQCTVGFCETSGTVCSDNSACDSGEDCIIGYCDTPDKSGASCSQDSDCSGIYDSCVDGACEDTLTGSSNTLQTCTTVSDCTLSSADTDGDGVSDTECAPGALAKTGTCFDDSCLVAISGTPFVKDNAEDQACRGFPEIDSPFSPDIVSAWTDPTGDLTSTVTNTNALSSDERDIIPNTYTSGFNDSKVCAPIKDPNDSSKYILSDDCVCSYDKAVYGTGASSRYYPVGTPATDVLAGVCSGGLHNGAECESNDDCNCLDSDPTLGSCSSVDSTASGICSSYTRKDTFYGWPGFCVERDTSVQLYGSSASADRACLTWLPVDQLQGSTDLYAKYLAAGYQGETEYCAEIDASYDLGTSSVACAEAYSACKDSNSWGTYASGNSDTFLGQAHDDGDCVGSIVCPNGYFAVMTGCGKLNFDENGDSSNPDDDNKMCTDGGDDDCPFFCVPKASYTVEDVSQSDGTSVPAGTACLDPESAGFNVKKTLDARDDIDSGNRGVPLQDGQDFKIYIVEDVASGYSFQNDVIDYYQNCRTRGITTSLSDFITPYDDLGSLPFNESSGGQGYRNLSWTTGVHAACTSVVQVAGATPYMNSNYNSAWTDRTWISSPSPWTIVDDDAEHFGYTPTTLLSVFGRATDYLSMNENDPDPYPMVPVVCTNDTSYKPDDPSDSLALIQTANADGLTCTESGWQVSDTTGEHARTYETVAGSTDDKKSTENGWSGACANADCSCDTGSEDTDCNDGISCDKTTDPANPICVGDGPNSGSECDTDEDCRVLSCIDFGTDLSGDVEYSFPDYQCGYASGAYLLASGPASDAIGRLEQIFAKSYDLISFTDGYSGIDDENTYGVTQEWTDNPGNSTGEYIDEDGENPSIWAWDVTATGVNGVSPEAPKVASIGQCYGNDCIEGDEGSITVNDIDSGTIEGDGGTKRVNVKFFAWASSDQMPIRNIIVDWGDGERANGLDDYAWPPSSQSGSTAETNFYQNHRGLTAENNPQCGDEDEWGLDSGACDTSYLNFQHDYRCGDTDPGSLPQCEYADDGTGRLLNSPCTGGVFADAADKCVFQPRVFVKDNWGWCTGLCTGGLDGTDGCYSSDTGDDECNFTACPSESIGSAAGVGGNPSCLDSSVGNPIDNPWVNYAGVIILDWQSAGG